MRAATAAPTAASIGLHKGLPSLAMNRNLDSVRWYLEPGAVRKVDQNVASAELAAADCREETAWS